MNSGLKVFLLPFCANFRWFRKWYGGAWTRARSRTNSDVIPDDWSPGDRNLTRWYRCDRERYVR